MESSLKRAVPDGSWGWVVVLGSFMVHCIADGISYSFGVFVDDFVDYFECSKSAVGGLGSLINGMTFCACPIGSALINKFGCRIVTIVGTLIAFFGLVISIWAPNIMFMYFSFGLVTGLGLSISYLPTIVVLSVYFDKRLSLAIGIAACGTGIGIFIIAPLANALLSRYSWKGTVLIEAGIMLNCILCGMVFRPLSGPETRREDTVEVPTAAEDESADVREPEQVKVRERSSSSPELSQMSPFNVDSQKSAGESATRSSVQLFSLLAETDTFSDKKFDHVLQRASVRGDSSVQVELKPHPNNASRSKVRSTQRYRAVCETFNFRLFFDLVFMLFAVSNLLTGIGLVVPYIFLADRGLYLGFDNTESSWLISVAGISNTIGRIVFGFLANMKFVDRLILYNTVRVLCGICSLLSVLLWTFTLQMCYSSVVGFCLGAYVCLTPIVLVDLFGVKKLTSAFGLVLLFRGFGSIAGPPFAGWLYDISNSYDNSFYMMGIFITISGLMLYPVPCIKRRRLRHNGKETSLNLEVKQDWQGSSNPVTE